MQIILIGILAFTVVAVMEALVHTLRFVTDKRKDELKRRLSSLGTSDAKAVTGLLRKGKLSAIPAIDALLRSIKLTARVESILEQTELEITVARLFAYCGAGAFVGLILGLLSDGGPLSGILVLLFGLLPFMFVLFMRSRRSRKLSEQLPEALEMMARSLRAGHALSSAFKMVATEMPTPVSMEFGRAFEAQELGLPFEKAVADMTRRAPDNQDLKIFALSVIVQKETGGNLVEIIEKIADTVRARYKFQGKLAGLTAEGRMSSYIVGALPFMTLLFLLFANRPYVMPLFTTDAGHYFLVGALVHVDAGVRLDEEHDQGDHLMGDLFAGISLELLVAVIGGLVCVVAIAVGARHMLGSRRDEVIERLERTTHGMDLHPHASRRAPRRPWRGSPASCVRSRAWPRRAGGRSSRGSRPTLIQAGYRDDNAVEVFLGVKLLLTPIAILLLWQINVHMDEPSSSR